MYNIKYIKRNVFSFKYLLQYFQYDCVNAVPLSLDYDVCCLREPPFYTVL
jgi:hypothetical protein